MGGAAIARTALVALLWAASAVTAQSSAAGSGTLPEHAELMAYAGEWDVFIGDIRVGSATAVERAGGRIVEFTLEGELGPMSTAVYLVGFDRRHAAYIVLAMDDSGDYWVDARGPRVGPVITALGVDDDPQFAQMGLTKEFVLAITLDDAHDPDREIFPSRMSIETRFIDTRTADREEIAFLSFDLRR